MTPEQQNAAVLLMNTMSWRKISKHLGLPKSTVSDYLRKVRDGEVVSERDGPKILFLDVEVQGSVNIAFPRFKANISPDAVLSEPYLLTYAANWLHEDENQILCEGINDWYIFTEGQPHNDIFLVEALYELLDEADIVIAHNAGFDVGQINARFAYHGIDPPSPYKVICTLQGLRKYFKLPANSLDASTKYFELERKHKHEGIKLWVDCYKGDEDAFERMKEYNRGDIPTLRQLYMKIRPFMQNHPNVGLYYNDDKIRCNTCGSDVMIKQDSKYAYTNLSKFETYRCDNCGSHKRLRKNVRTKEQMMTTLMNI